MKPSKGHPRMVAGTSRLADSVRERTIARDVAKSSSPIANSIPATTPP
jgi:hypothetical protein